MILAGAWWAQDPGPEPAYSKRDEDAPVCRDCKTAVHDGNLCLECARDRRELAIQRDREWWAE